MQQQWDAARVEAELSGAGRTLCTLQVPGCRPAGYRSAMPEMIQEVHEAYGWTGLRVRPPIPSSRDIAKMDQVLSWVRLIPADQYVKRRIVGARLLTHPVTERPLYGFRKIAALLGASHEAVRGWHAIGISIIVGHLNKPGFCAAAGGRVGRGRPVVDAAIGRAAAQARRPTRIRMPEPA